MDTMILVNKDEMLEAGCIASKQLDFTQVYNHDELRVDDYMKTDDIIELLEDLVIEYNHLREEFDDYKENVAENYQQILYKEQI